MVEYKNNSPEMQLTTKSLTELRVGLMVPQRQAGLWAAPSSVRPDALMSGYEMNAFKMPAETAARLSAALIDWHNKMLMDEAWVVLASAPITIPKIGK